MATVIIGVSLMLMIFAAVGTACCVLLAALYAIKGRI